MVVTTIGIDPHKATLTAVAIDDDEIVLGEFTIRADKDQTTKLIDWAGSVNGDARVWAVEAATGLGRALDTVKTQIRRAVTETDTTVTDTFGVGPVVAAFLIGYTPPIERFTTADRHEAYNGTAPIEVSSAGKVRHRLSRRGNRTLNHAIHTAAVTQIRRHTPGRIYYDKKLGKGKTNKEAPPPNPTPAQSPRPKHPLDTTRLRYGGSVDSPRRTAQDRERLHARRSPVLVVVLCTRIRSECVSTKHEPNRESDGYHNQQSRNDDNRHVSIVSPHIRRFKVDRPITVVKSHPIWAGFRSKRATGSTITSTWTTHDRRWHRYLVSSQSPVWRSCGSSWSRPRW